VFYAIYCESGVEKTYTGTAVPMPGASIGYLSQEPTLEGKTVMDNINLGVQKGQQLLDRFNDLSVKCGEVLTDDEMAAVMDELTTIQDTIEAGRSLSCWKQHQLYQYVHIF
jgi:sulfate-transporting ATPase